MDNTFCVLVQNRIKAGYRRAGFSFQPGDNTLTNVSASQLAQLKADPRLVVQVTEQKSGQKGNEGLSDKPTSGDKSESVRDGALPADLTALTAEQLKAMLTEQGIEFKKSATKAELIALLTEADNTEAN